MQSEINVHRRGSMWSAMKSVEAWHHVLDKLSRDSWEYLLVDFRLRDEPVRDGLQFLHSRLIVGQ